MQLTLLTVEGVRRSDASIATVDCPGLLALAGSARAQVVMARVSITPRIPPLGGQSITVWRDRADANRVFLFLRR
jgi:hypothetical protein